MVCLLCSPSQPVSSEQREDIGIFFADWDTMDEKPPPPEQLQFHRLVAPIVHREPVVELLSRPTESTVGSTFQSIVGSGENQGGLPQESEVKFSKEYPSLSSRGSLQVELDVSEKEEADISNGNAAKDGGGVAVGNLSRGPTLDKRENMDKPNQGAAALFGKRVLLDTGEEGFVSKHFGKGWLEVILDDDKKRIKVKKRTGDLTIVDGNGRLAPTSSQMSKPAKRAKKTELIRGDIDARRSSYRSNRGDEDMDSGARASVEASVGGVITTNHDPADTLRFFAIALDPSAPSRALADAADMCKGAATLSARPLHSSAVRSQTFFAFIA